MLFTGILSPCINLSAQQNAAQKEPYFFNSKVIPSTPVKNQAATNTCWCFASTSLLESQCKQKSGRELDLSEMYTVRNIYLEKARNYILRQGHAQFGEGGLGHDEIHAVERYGAMPENVYSGLLPGETKYNHQTLFPLLQKYLDSILLHIPVADNWIDGYKKIIDDHLGVPPSEFIFNGKKYTPRSFAREVLQFNANDYVYLTAFTHHPYYKNFILEVPDNFSNQEYYNVPINELLSIVKQSINKGYSVMWDADVSNKGFMQGMGFALNLEENVNYSANDLVPDMKEAIYNAELRQKLFENLTTQDDHLMHITGIETTKGGKTFFIVKNSWGVVGNFKGYINVSEAYFSINTISIVLPRAALSKEFGGKL